MITAMIEPYQTPATRIMRAMHGSGGGGATTTGAPPPPLALPAARPAAPPERQLPSYPPPSNPNWGELMANDRVFALPITDMKSGGYDKTNTPWLDRAFHPSQDVHPNEKQRRALRKIIAINRILDIANGTNANALKRAGIKVPSNDQMLADFQPSPIPEGGKTGWYNIGENAKRKWHIYKKLVDIARANKFPVLSHVQAADKYAQKGGTLQGFGQARATRSFGEAPRGSQFDCRRDRFGACIPGGEADSLAINESDTGPGGGQLPPGSLQTAAKRPPRGTLQTSSTVPDRRGTFQRSSTRPPPRESLQRDAGARPGPRGTLQPFDPGGGSKATLQRRTDPGGPRGSFQRDAGRGDPGATFQTSSTVIDSAPSAMTASLATAASTSYAPSAADSNLSGFFDEIGRFMENIGDTAMTPLDIAIQQGQQVVTAPFEIVGPGVDAAKQLVENLKTIPGAGNIAAAIPGPWGAALSSILGPTAYGPPVAPPPQQSSMSQALPWIATAAGVAGVLILATKK